jgi:hypothetical protein
MADGRRVSLIIDPEMVESATGPPREVYGNVDALVRPDLRHHYATPLGAQRWLDVCDDPGYGHAALLEKVERALPSLAGALHGDDMLDRLALTSLGPGDGSVDELILRGLGCTFEVSSYCAVDSSLELLLRSLRRIVHAEGLSSSMVVHGVLGDIRGVTSMPRSSPGAPAARLLVLTGFTLGNYPEAELLRGVRALMEPGDHLLLDARLHTFGPLPPDLSGFRRSNGRIFGSYDLPSVRRFVFGPLEVATTAAVDDVTVDFDVTRSVTEVPNALNLLIHCRDLDTVVRLTGQRIVRDRLDLAVTTLYRLPDLLTWFSGAGLEPIWHHADGDVAFFLVRRG